MMAEKWRFLNTGSNTAYDNMAVDRAIMAACSENKVPPTVRFYSWTPAAISIGYFQSLEEEVDVEKCSQRGIDFVRRITGGGAVFHEDELTYSIIIPESHDEIPGDILGSYKRICGALMKGFDCMDVSCEYRPINDILVDGKKISGNAQTRQKKTVLQHGTILLDVDVEKMFSLLKIPSEKTKDKLIKNVKESVTSLTHVFNKKIYFEDAVEDMKKGFEKEFNIKLKKGSLSDYEKKLAE
ncbi:MAG: biotin/lipoate A/B protein ligase family protein, partial [Candidatus Thermoplasmatota archaeon]